MEPLYHLKEIFWPDKSLLYQEALAIKNEAKVWESETSRFVAHGINEKTPLLLETYNNFMKVYPYDWGTVIGSYMFIDANKGYPWHIDRHVAVDLCAINIIISGDENEVEFLGRGKFLYDAAVFNTSYIHRINPTTDRILLRLSFRDKEYSEVVGAINKLPAGESTPMIYESPDKGKTIYKRKASYSDLEAEHYYNQKVEVELDPDKRDWEYDGTGIKIYKVEAGKPHKTPYESK